MTSSSFQSRHHERYHDYGGYYTFSVLSYYSHLSSVGKKSEGRQVLGQLYRSLQLERCKNNDVPSESSSDSSSGEWTPTRIPMMNEVCRRGG